MSVPPPLSRRSKVLSVLNLHGSETRSTWDTTLTSSTTVAGESWDDTRNEALVRTLFVCLIYRTSYRWDLRQVSPRSTLTRDWHRVAREARDFTLGQVKHRGWFVDSPLSPKTRGTGHSVKVCPPDMSKIFKG